jgi:hypothetical protein
LSTVPERGSPPIEPTPPARTAALRSAAPTSNASRRFEPGR